MFEVGNVAIYVIRNAEVVWGGILWSRQLLQRGQDDGHHRAVLGRLHLLPGAAEVGGLPQPHREVHDLARPADAGAQPQPRQQRLRLDWATPGYNSGNVDVEGGYESPLDRAADPRGRVPTHYRGVAPQRTADRGPARGPGLGSAPRPPSTSRGAATTWTTSGSQLEQFANTSSLVDQTRPEGPQGFEYRVLCWYDGNQGEVPSALHLRRDDLHRRVGMPTTSPPPRPAIIQPVFGQLHEDANNTIFDFPGHIIGLVAGRVDGERRDPHHHDRRRVRGGQDRGVLRRHRDAGRHHRDRGGRLVPLRQGRQLRRTLSYDRQSSAVPTRC